MGITIVHYSLFGGTSKVSNRFKYDSTSMEGYIENDNKIVIIARRFYSNDWSKLAVIEFIKEYKDKIIGVILVDDKSYGQFYGEYIKVFTDEGLPILAVLDRLVSNEDIESLEATIDAKV